MSNTASNTLQDAHVYAIILAGGVGSRFWPLSRQVKPKQFLDIMGIGETFIQTTFTRMKAFSPVNNIYVVTHADYVDAIREQVPGVLEENILVEPTRRNTTAAIAYAAHKIYARDKDATLIIAPSDHYITDTSAYIDVLKTALAAAQHDKLVTIGITPTRPDTGYGYIHFDKHSTGDTYKVLAFTEKPPQETAIKFLRSGDYLWNSGMFVWRADTIIKALNKQVPQLNNLFVPLAWNTPAEKQQVSTVYEASPSISIDYSVMEKADNVYVIPGQFGWSDVGTWASLYSVSEKNTEENVLHSPQLVIEDCEGCIIKTEEGKATVVKGLRDYIVVDTKDALLIYPKSKEQEIRDVLEHVKKELGETFL